MIHVPEFSEIIRHEPFPPTKYKVTYVYSVKGVCPIVLPLKRIVYNVRLTRESDRYEIPCAREFLTRRFKQEDFNNRESLLFLVLSFRSNSREQQCDN